MPITTITAALEEERLRKLEGQRVKHAASTLDVPVRAQETAPREKHHEHLLHAALGAPKQLIPGVYTGLARCEKSIMVEAGVCVGVILGLGHPAWIVGIHYGIASVLVHKLRVRDGYAISLCFSLEAMTNFILRHGA